MTQNWILDLRRACSAALRNSNRGNLNQLTPSPSGCVICAFLWQLIHSAVSKRLRRYFIPLASQIAS
jgi:hypothetical protein